MPNFLTENVYTLLYVPPKLIKKEGDTHHQAVAFVLSGFLCNTNTNIKGGGMRVTGADLRR